MLALLMGPEAVAPIIIMLSVDLIVFSSLIVMLGTTLGPLIAGILYDRTGSYELAFTIIAMIAAFGSIFFMLAWRPSPPTRSAPPSIPASDVSQAAG